MNRNDETRKSRLSWYDCSLSGGAQSDRRISLFVISPEPINTLGVFLQDERINPRKLFTRRLVEVGIIATPTVLLVDAGGVVRHVFVGQLDEIKERQLLGLLNVTGSTSPGRSPLIPLLAVFSDAR